MQTEKIKLTALRNDEYFQFNTEFRDLVNASNPETLKVSTMFTQYKKNE